MTTPGGGVGGPVSSAGVYDSTGTLVRTMWSAVTNAPGVANPAAAWDGLTDLGNVAPTGTYTVQLIQHNIQYHWDGVLGNTSPDHSSVFYHGWFDVIHDIALTSTELYFVQGYSERYPCEQVVKLSNPQAPRPTVQASFRVPYTTPIVCCTDGTLAYFAIQSTANLSFVYAVSTTDNALESYLTLKTPWTFSAGTSYSFGNVSSVCAYNTNPSNFVNQASGIAVQQSGSYLFIAYGELNEVLTLNKTTGAILQTNTTLTNPQRIATDPATGNLWVVHDNTGPVTVIDKFTVDGSGNLVSAGVTITGLAPLGLSVTFDGLTLLVVNNNTQQVHAFNTSDGSVKTAFGTSGVFGTLNGYVNSPAVTPYKWMFRNVLGHAILLGSITCAHDGSFWLCDNGTYRCLHFSSGNSPTYIEQIAYLPVCYNQRVVRGAETRVIADFLEYQVNYSQSVNPNLGSWPAGTWTLTNNWFGNVSPSFFPPIDTYTGAQQYAYLAFQAFLFHTVLSNGRTYAAMQVSTFDMRIVELTSTGLRLCAAPAFPPNGLIPNAGRYFDANWNQWTFDAFSAGSTSNIYLNAFAGFDGSGNPMWSTNQAGQGGQGQGPIAYTTQVMPPGMRIQIGYEFAHIETLSNGVVPLYETDSSITNSAHLAGLNLAAGTIAFQTHYTTPVSTPQTYGGWGNPFSSLVLLFYPEAPYFPVTDGVGTNGGGPLHYQPGDTHFFTGYRGEDWANNQTNVWSHWHESGLLLNRFGTLGPYSGPPGLDPYTPAGAASSPVGYAVGGTVPTLSYNPSFPSNPSFNNDVNGFYSWRGLPGFAGNSAYGSFHYEGSNNTYYIYQNDEWYHNGIHRWSVTNTNTIKVTSQTVNWNSSSYVPPNDPGNLLQGIPYNQPDLPNGTAGWQRLPTDNLNTTRTAPFAWVYTSATTADTFTPDLAFECQANDNTIPMSLSHALPSGTTNTWTLSSKAMFYVSGTAESPVLGVSSNALAIEIHDAAGRIIVQTWTGYNGAANTLWIINNVQKLSLLQGQFEYYVQNLFPFSISANVLSGVITVNWGQLGTATSTILDPLANIAAPAMLVLNYVPGQSAAIVFQSLEFKWS